MAEVFLHHAGVDKLPVDIRCKVGASWLPPKQAWVKHAGVWSLFWNTEISLNSPAGASANGATIFGADWSAQVHKRLVIPNGISIGTLTLPAGRGGDLIIEVSGEIQGTSGVAGSGLGGHAIIAAQSFELIVNPGGAVRAGGGGGGVGGQGGAGVWYSGRTVNEGPVFDFWAEYGWSVTGGNNSFNWYGITGNAGGAKSYTLNGWTYYPGALQSSASDGSFYSYNLHRYTTVYDVVNYTSGGAPQPAGRGQGYGNVPTNGANGVGGGTNAGASGKSGNGGIWGTKGEDGNAGASGNAGAGMAGAVGGAPGKAVSISSGAVTVTNNGTINGATS